MNIVLTSNYVRQTHRSLTLMSEEEIADAFCLDRKKLEELVSEGMNGVSFPRPVTDPTSDNRFWDRRAVTDWFSDLAIETHDAGLVYIAGFFVRISDVASFFLSDDGSGITIVNKKENSAIKIFMTYSRSIEAIKKLEDASSKSE